MTGTGAEVAKGVPVVAIAAAPLFGLSLGEWTQVVAIVWGLVLIVHRLWHWRTPPGK